MKVTSVETTFILVLFLWSFFALTAVDIKIHPLIDSYICAVFKVKNLPFCCFSSVLIIFKQLVKQR